MHFWLIFKTCNSARQKWVTDAQTPRARTTTHFFIPYHPRALSDRFVTIVCLFPFIFKRGVVHHGRRSAQIPRLRIRNRKVVKNMKKSCYFVEIVKIRVTNQCIFCFFKTCNFARQKWVTDAQTPRTRMKTHLFIPYHPRALLDRFVTRVCLFPFIFKRGVVHHGRHCAQIPRLRIRNRKVVKNITTNHTILWDCEN